MAEGDDDPLVRELRALRKGSGLRPSKLRNAPTILAALGTTDLVMAEQRLVAALKRLGEDVRPLALTSAYAIGMSKPGLLTQRRGDFAVLLDKHADTVEGWENDAIDELAVSLTSIQSAPVHLKRVIIICHVRDGAIKLTSTRKVGLDDGHSQSAPMDYRSGDGPRELLYRIPPNWRVRTLAMQAVFEDDAEEAWMGTAPDAVDLLAGRGREPAEIKRGLFGRRVEVRWDHPVSGHYYGIFWRC